MAILQKDKPKIFLREVVGASSGPQDLRDAVWCSLLVLLFSSYSERREGNLGGMFKPRARV